MKESVTSLELRMAACVDFVDFVYFVYYNKPRVNRVVAELKTPTTTKECQSDITFCYSARNLGVMFDSGLTMKQQAERICQTAYFEIRRIGSIRQFLTTEAIKKIKSCHISSAVPFRLL